MTGGNPLIWYAVAYGGSATVLKAIGFLLFLWLAHSMSVEEYGKFGLFYAVQTGLATLAIAGIGESVVGLLKEHKRQEERLRLFVSANAVFMAIGTVSTLLAFLVFGLLILFSTQSFSGFEFAILAGLITSFLTLQANLVRLNEKHMASLSLNFIGSLAGLAGGGVGYLIGQSASAFFLGSAILLGLSVVGFHFAGVGFYGFTHRIRDMYPIVLRVGPFIAIAFLGWLSGYGTNSFIQVLFTSQEVARFTFGFSLASIMQLVASALNQVWSPRFYKIANEQTAHVVEAKNKRFFRWQGIAMGAAGSAVVALFPIAADTIGGNLVAYRDMTLELLLLFTAYIILVPWWHVQNYFLLHGEGRQLMEIVVKTSVIGLGAALLLMVIVGPLGIYLGFLVQMVARMIGAVRIAKERWHITLAWDGVAIGLALLGIGFVAAQLF